MTALTARLLDAFRRHRLRRRTVAALEQLDDRLLDDAGIDRYDIPEIAARQAAARVARERIERNRRAALRAAEREQRLARIIRTSPRFRLALDQAAVARDRIPAAGRSLPASRIPSVVDDIALGAFFGGRPCASC